MLRRAVRLGKPPRGLASHATVIDRGQIVETAGIEELKANDYIRQRFLAL
jgi:branched-chain amino acid transport system ATP-binding protein